MILGSGGGFFSFDRIFLDMRSIIWYLTRVVFRYPKKCLKMAFLGPEEVKSGYSGHNLRGEDVGDLCSVRRKWSVPGAILFP